MIFLKNSSVPNICDGGGLYLKDIKPLNEYQNLIIGEVITVNTNDNDWGTAVYSISQSKNKIIVINVVGNNYAIWGGLATLNSKLNGVIGVIINGAVRDVEEIKKLKFPIFSKNIIGVAGKPLNNGTINCQIKINNVLIEPGDIAVGDLNGVCIIKKNNLQNVINNVKNIKNKEENIKNKLHKGLDLKDILKL